ncbi:MAG: DEAD/DEAH box helicase family protein [Polyangiales bacterium]|nr:DEAD/DEAH box helicase family protein [Myxococcales bacterium]MCB9656367.1 DEAD/DEAH box helicase [Sandaracinaceae bacterium]
MITLRFTGGTLLALGLARDASPPTDAFVWDTRSDCYRAPAVHYADTVRALLRAGSEYTDEARDYPELGKTLRVHREPRFYQREAMEAFARARSRGLVVLPTGAGKSHVAVMAIAKHARATLVVAPTLDLVRQWYDLLRASFGGEVGVVGGGDHRVLPLTVTTYDSAHLHMPHLGARFGMVIYDEVHHLPGESYALAARGYLAPFRLGLSATLERADGRHADLTELVGPVVYRKDIVELSGDFLADYETEKVSVDLSPDERARYDKARGVYRGFVLSQGIRMSSPHGWGEFVQRSTWSDEGQRAMAAYREQRHIAFAAEAKLEMVEHLLHRHRADRTLLFTQDNATAYDISRRFLVPAITHQTRVTERSEILEGLASGRYRAVVTSKVLNEGVDVPDANVAIIVSGSGSVREHVQRLGRVLRKVGDKRAVLYELVTADTHETFTSERRREHSAYR